LADFAAAPYTRPRVQKEPVLPDDVPAILAALALDLRGLYSSRNAPTVTRAGSHLMRRSCDRPSRQ